jgi:hypothetical protein
MSIDALQERLEVAPLSSALRTVLRIAERHGVADVAAWCRLELGGYWSSNPAMANSIVVPEYRTVRGQHVDIYGRSLMVDSKLAFVNETRLRYGVDELEALTTNRDTVEIQDPKTRELIRDHLSVEVHSFRFSAVHVKGILSEIRTELVTRANAMAPLLGRREAVAAEMREDILELKPNLWGLGVNLRALWRRIKNGARG